MPGACVNADSGHDFTVIAVDEDDLACCVALKKFGKILDLCTPLSTRLPRRSHVILVFVFLNPDGRLREKIQTTHMIPVNMTDNYVGNLFRLNTSEFDRFVGSNVIGCL